MPESPELRIMSDFINQKSNNRFTKAYHVSKGNIATEFDKSEIDSSFLIEAESNGKELRLHINKDNSKYLLIYVFMGMNGNWKWVNTSEWNETKFTRLRFDSEDGNSLLLYGGFMGPKYSVGKAFGGTKRGPDPTKEFDKFKENILSNLNNKAFDKPICEALLNQEYFNGIGNYIRSTVLYYADVNPFESARNIIQSNSKVLELCKEIPLQSYQFNGGQLKDWSNPFDVDSTEFKKWVFYQKGLCCKDKTGRTFWFDTKWESECPYPIKKIKVKS